MNKITNSAFLVLLISFFVLTSCEKEDSNVGSSLNITLNPGQGLTTANLEGLKLGIVKLPDGTTENDNLDSLTWTSEPTWFIDSAITNRNIVFKDLTPGIYLAEIDNDTLQFETFNNDTNAIYIHVENGETTNQAAIVGLSKVDNNSGAITDDYIYRDKVIADKRLTVTLRCYNKDKELTKKEQLDERNIFKQEGTAEHERLVGHGHGKELKDLYKIKNFSHCLRDEFYYIEVEIINNSDGTKVTRSVHPKDKSWKAYTSLNESVVIGEYKIELLLQYINTCGVDKFRIEVANPYGE